ncbi:uracil-DNA glycosylase family protein [Myceligenerans pegani]|uniref:Uracil-DNA glycosylase family protein n=1 Tax=Myceligenerans pegani TaxID=2776917 RepID=A0ABR9MYS2_9MICO|nr:uracil-DNA glycosylase family protein [Myceligenerans sp. TRM 65318]MBE1876545.1 uracil-DNA glycosylase family protein [Myceligenerans sp. TRM 65318]MBE3018816.1 uracil-DNA glycosylase family protein [Myceligenerans sp. TRM 65318]
MRPPSAQAGGTSFESIRAAVVADPENAWARELGYSPLYTAGPHARVAVIGQAPGRQAQESGLPWNDASGTKLFEWLGVTENEFRDPERFAVLPMDFYYPGKGSTGDLPPRKSFAPRWHPPVLDLMPQIRLTVLIGSYAQQYYLADRAKRNLTETVHAFREYLPAIIPVAHPSPLNFRWQARNPWFTTDVLPVLRARVASALAE